MELDKKLIGHTFKPFTTTVEAGRLDLAALAARNIPVSGTEFGPSKDSTCELTWTLILAATKQLLPRSVWTSPPPEPPRTNLRRAVAQREPSSPIAMPSSSVMPSPSLSPSRRRAARADASAARPHAR